MPRKRTVPDPTAPNVDSEAHFDAVLAAAGHDVPTDRREQLLVAYRDLRKQAAIVRKVPLDATLEPANTYSLVPYTKRAGE